MLGFDMNGLPVPAEQAPGVEAFQPGMLLLGQQLNQQAATSGPPPGPARQPQAAIQPRPPMQPAQPNLEQQYQQAFGDSMQMRKDQLDELKKRLADTQANK